MDDDPGGAGLSLALDPAQLAAFNGHVETLRSGLMRYAGACLTRSGMIRDPDDVAYDCVQEAFIRLEKLMRLGKRPFVPDSGPHDVRRWLYRATWYRVRTEIRNVKRRPQTSLEDLCDAQGFDVGDAGFEEILVSNTRFDELLAQVNPVEQEILRLCIREGFDNEKIAALLRKNPGAVRQTKLRALRKVEKVLFKDDADGVIAARA